VSVAGLVLFSVTPLASHRALSDQLSLEFRCRTQNVQEEAGCWILLVGVKGLGNRYESDSILLEEPDVVQAID
jgi:hypothetical protein